MRHAVHSLYKGAAEALLPVRSAAGGFRESGCLTPEEFVAAGDFLVATCPTWSWQARRAASALFAKMVCGARACLPLRRRRTAGRRALQAEVVPAAR